jgi:hypothetical protein
MSIGKWLYTSRKIVVVLVDKVGRDSAVGIATRYGLDGPGVKSRWGTRFSAPVQTGLGAHPVSYTMGTRSFPGVKQPGRGVDHPPHLTPRLKKEYNYTSIPLIGLRGLFQGKVNFAFTLPSLIKATRSFGM